VPQLQPEDLRGDQAGQVIINILQREGYLFLNERKGTMSTGDFAERIKKEMISDHENAIEKNYELAKRLILLSKSGKVEILNKDKLNAKEQISLYLVGKLYAKVASLSTKESVDNTELLHELGMREGTLYPALKSLREEKVIKQGDKKNEHIIMTNMVEQILKGACRGHE
jgi:hypothetical protein